MASYKVEYEWDIEDIDKHGDIIDHDFREKLAELANHGGCPDGTVTEDLCLVRSIGNDDEGVVHRSWAYVTAAGLPATFDDNPGGFKVPQKYLKEFDRNREWAIK